jgi:hypothetical protein
MVRGQPRHKVRETLSQPLSGLSDGLYVIPAVQEAYVEGFWSRLAQAKTQDAI